jgi:hypothetical protein
MLQPSIYERLEQGKQGSQRLQFFNMKDTTNSRKIKPLPNRPTAEKNPDQPIGLPIINKNYLTQAKRVFFV